MSLYTDIITSKTYAEEDVRIDQVIANLRDEKSPSVVEQEISSFLANNLINYLLPVAKEYTADQDKADKAYCIQQEVSKTTSEILDHRFGLCLDYNVIAAHILSAIGYEVTWAIGDGGGAAHSYLVVKPPSGSWRIYDPMGIELAEHYQKTATEMFENAYRFPIHADDPRALITALGNI